MLNLNELEQLLAFAEKGTLSLAAESLHISQPTITRTMQHLEETFGVSLFYRGKNKITLNATGEKAVEQARQLLTAADNALKSVAAFDKSLHTITVSSCAPAPLWFLLPALSVAWPHMTISSSLKNVSAVLKDLACGSCQLGILPADAVPEPYVHLPFLEEHLYICIPFSHNLADKTSVTFSDINGFNFLLRSEIGFWDEMCRVQMPASHFLVQTDDFTFRELIRESSLPCFTTDLAHDYEVLLESRVKIPITDPQANVIYHLVCRQEHKSYLDAAKQIRPDKSFPL